MVVNLQIFFKECHDLLRNNYNTSSNRVGMAQTAMPQIIIPGSSI